MNTKTFRILKHVEKNGEISLAAAIRLISSPPRDHVDQYPLALLLESGYLGMTINHMPPNGAESMREYSLATTLHMFSIPKDAEGEAHYLGITSRGGINPDKQRVFLKAKGALYLDEQRQKFWDRIWSFSFGLLAGLLVAVGSAWLKGQLKLP